MRKRNLRADFGDQEKPTSSPLSTPHLPSTRDPFPRKSLPGIAVLQAGQQQSPGVPIDVGSTNAWKLAAQVEASQGELTPLSPLYLGEVARRYRTAAGGEIGIIASVTRPFCSHCNRARLTAEGSFHLPVFLGRDRPQRPAARRRVGRGSLPNHP